MDNSIVADVTYIKEMDCPVCMKKFKARFIKTGKNKLINTELDLRARYELVDPTIYDVWHCDCGYTALSKTFERVSKSQREQLKQQICSKYKKHELSEYLTIPEAIALYKLALLCANVKGVGTGETAMICLKIAWLSKDINDIVTYGIYIAYAGKYMEDALSDGSLRKLGIDDTTAMYTVAALQYTLGEKDKAMKMIGSIITDQSVTNRIKQKAVDLKYLIKEERRKADEV